MSRQSADSAMLRSTRVSSLRHLGILIVCVLVVTIGASLLFTSAGLAQGQPPPTANPFARLAAKAAVAQTAPSAPAPAPSRLEATSANISWVECPPDASSMMPGVSCGYLPVPLDRTNPAGQKIDIYFEVYPHWGPGPAESAILFNHGGPGLTTTGYRGLWAWFFGENLDKHDLLLIDNRGRGNSGAIDCPELQWLDAKAPNAENLAFTDEAMAACAAKLGSAAGRYGSGDIAQDTEDVRAALGYDKIDYVGISWGGVDVTAYATRFGEHLRSIVLDAPIGTPFLQPFVGGRFQVLAGARVITLNCLRSPTCSAVHPDPDADLEALIETVRRSPFEGDAYDATGTLRHVLVDEAALIKYLAVNWTGTFVNTGEVLAAGTALKKGDTAPLLRLVAEGAYQEGSPAPASWYSAGAAFATRCADVTQPFDWTASVDARAVQYAEAAKRLPANFFRPFSKHAQTNLLNDGFSRRCLYWEMPTPPAPVTPPDAVYPSAPTLVLDGDLDPWVPLDETTKVAALYPKSTFVTLKGVGHAGIDWSPCATGLESSFIKNLQVGDTACADKPMSIWPAVGRFPLKAAQARPAEANPDGQNQIGLPERRVVTVAVAAATDAVQRTIILGAGEGRGLRAGTFHNEGSPAGWVTTLTGCAFTTDVIVDGAVTIAWTDDGRETLVADLTVSGEGTAGGTLHVEGYWRTQSPAGNYTVTGTLGGKNVAVLLPDA